MTSVRELLPLLTAFAFAVPWRPAIAEPPFSGTVFIAPNLITSSMTTRFADLTYTGRGDRLMFDRRINAFATYNAYLFDATYADGLTIEFQVNPEFGSVSAAQSVVETYAPVIGRLPYVLREDVETGWIHQGDEPFGGGNNNLLIHTGSEAQSYIDTGTLEEALAHEAAHTSLDPDHEDAPGWLAAQKADPEFISTYARDNPEREDIAESFVPWLAVHCAPDRTDPGVIQTIEDTIPNRLDYFAAAGFNLEPLDCDPSRIFRDRFE